MEESNTPDWLTADFLKSCLESDEDNKEKVVITGYNVGPGVPPGNNYGSSILRVKVTYKKLFDSTEHLVSLIIKAPLVDGAFVEQYGDVLKESFEKEPKYYNEFIRESYKLMVHNIVPKNYKSPYPLSVVLEDLKESGFTMVDRRDLLDFNHCELYVRASAKLHALSIVVHKTQPDIIESLAKKSPVVDEKSRIVFKGLISNLFKCMAAFIEDQEGYKEFDDFFRDVSENDKFYCVYEEVEKSKRKLTAVIQGDPWSTNMMFKYNKLGEVIDVKLFDFQSLIFTSPVRELVTFVWTSAKPEVRENRLDELYQLYCDSLNGTFEQLGCSERLSFEELKTDILFLSPWVLVTVCVMAPFCLTDEIVDMSEVLTPILPDVPIKESLPYKLYQGPTFKKYYPKVLDHVAREGVFDYTKQKMKQLT
uniref:CHK kinase-like domain-containing protein n=1 Tax=Graphocephala atropunctata TaxID=36148 RepID=A0A1B6MRQ6_9HEMI